MQPKRRDQALAQEMMAQLAAAQSRLKLKEVQLDRIKQLTEQNAATRQQFEEAVAELERACAEVDKLKQLLILGAARDRVIQEDPPTRDTRVAEAEVKQSEAMLQAAEAKLQLQEESGTGRETGRNQVRGRVHA